MLCGKMVTAISETVRDNILEFHVIKALEVPARARDKRKKKKV
jgi:hypothetical protein